MFDRALDIYRATLGEQNLQTAAALNGLAAAAVWTDDYPLAEHYQREALAIFQATSAATIPTTPLPWRRSGYILTQRGKVPEAEQVLNEALQIESNVFGIDNQRIAAIQADLGILYDREGDIPRAIAATQTALRITRDRLGAQPLHERLLPRRPGAICI